MKVKVEKYGRWDESCNWQRESTVEKDLPEDVVNSLEWCGYKHIAKYNEYHLEFGNNLVIIKVIG